MDLPNTFSKVFYLSRMDLPNTFSKVFYLSQMALPNIFSKVFCGFLISVPISNKLHK